MRGAQPFVSGFEVKEGTGRWGLWQRLAAGKGKETDFSLELPEEIQPHRHLDLIPGRLALDLGPAEL